MIASYESIAGRTVLQHGTLHIYSLTYCDFKMASSNVRKFCVAQLHSYLQQHFTLVQTIILIIQMITIIIMIIILVMIIIQIIIILIILIMIMII